MQKTLCFVNAPVLSSFKSKSRYTSPILRDYFESLPVPDNFPSLAIPQLASPPHGYIPVSIIRDDRRYSARSMVEMVHRHGISAAAEPDAIAVQKRPRSPEMKRDINDKAPFDTVRHRQHGCGLMECFECHESTSSVNRVIQQHDHAALRGIQDMAWQAVLEEHRQRAERKGQENERRIRERVSRDRKEELDRARKVEQVRRKHLGNPEEHRERLAKLRGLRAEIQNYNEEGRQLVRRQMAMAHATTPRERLQPSESQTYIGERQRLDRERKQEMKEMAKLDAKLAVERRLCSKAFTLGHSIEEMKLQHHVENYYTLVRLEDRPNRIYKLEEEARKEHRLEYQAGQRARLAELGRTLAREAETAAEKKKQSRILKASRFGERRTSTNPTLTRHNWKWSKVFKGSPLAKHITACVSLHE